MDIWILRACTSTLAFIETFSIGPKGPITRHSFITFRVTFIRHLADLFRDTIRPASSRADILQVLSLWYCMRNILLRSLSPNAVYKSRSYFIMHLLHLCPMRPNITGV